MRKKHRSIKVIAIFLLIISICSVFTVDSNVVYGEVNEMYLSGDTTGTIDVDQAVKDSTILDSIARFIYAIAGFIEKIVSKLIGYFTGSNTFPWADRVIFNTIPFLDINFINPSSGSMFESASQTGNGTMTAFGKIIANMYYTIFVLAIAFLGVIVGVMAIKLAISSIASEKAKYKQAIGNWLLALILVFTSHYLISFIFFVNEKMVEVASTLLLNQMENISFSIDVNSWTNEECQALVDLLSQCINESNSAGIENTDDITSIDGTFSTNAWTERNNIHISSNIAYGANHEKGYMTNEYIKNLGNKVICMLLTNDDYMEHKSFYDPSTNGKARNFLQKRIEFFSKKKASIQVSKIHEIVEDAAKIVAEMCADTPTSDIEEYLSHYYGIMFADYDASPQAAASLYLDSASDKKDVITNMSAFFKNSVYTFKRDKNGDIASATASEFSAIPAILYSIFVIQSIMYFISYMKRFFYIIVLALFAPLVIIYDFFTKSVST